MGGKLSSLVRSHSSSPSTFHTAFRQKAGGLQLSNQASRMAGSDGSKTVGLNCHARVGQRVQLTAQGRKSLDERFHKISGGRAGTIVAVLGDGALATVRWDVAPSEEHQYRVGRFGRFELVRASSAVLGAGPCVSES